MPNKTDKFYRHEKAECTENRSCQQNVQLAASVYNLKKWLKYTAPKTAINAMALMETKQRKGFGLLKNILLQLILSPVAASKFLCPSMSFVKK